MEPDGGGILANAFRKAIDRQQRVRAVWEKGLRIQGLDPTEWRWDDNYVLIQFSEYGKQTKHGWEIDHRQPSAFGGLDVYANMRPLHWQTNRQLGGLISSMMK